MPFILFSVSGRFRLTWTARHAIMRIMSLERKYLTPEKPTVYVWKTNKGEYLYIGSSMNPIERILNHDVIDKLRKVKRSDSIIFISFDTREQMLKMETSFIRNLKPKFNKRQLEKREIKNNARILNTIVYL